MEKGGPAALVPASEKRFADLLSTSQEHKSGALSHSRSKRPRLTGTAHVCDAEICFGILNLEMLDASIIKKTVSVSRARRMRRRKRGRSARSVRYAKWYHLPEGFTVDESLAVVHGAAMLRSSISALVR